MNECIPDPNKLCDMPIDGCGNFLPEGTTICPACMCAGETVNGMCNRCGVEKCDE